MALVAMALVATALVATARAGTAQVGTSHPQMRTLVGDVLDVLGGRVE